MREISIVKAELFAMFQREKQAKHCLNVLGFRFRNNIDTRDLYQHVNVVKLLREPNESFFPICFIFFSSFLSFSGRLLIDVLFHARNTSVVDRPSVDSDAKHGNKKKSLISLKITEFEIAELVLENS